MAEEAPESKKHLNRNAALIALALLGVNMLLIPQVTAVFPNIPPELFHYAQTAGLSLHIIGRVIDSVATNELFKKVLESKKMGIPQHFKEGSPILPATPTIKDLLNPRVLLVDAMELWLTSQVPFYGALRFTASSIGAFVNKESRKTVLKNMRDGLS